MKVGPIWVNTQKWAWQTLCFCVFGNARSFRSCSHHTKRHSWVAQLKRQWWTKRWPQINFRQLLTKKKELQTCFIPCLLACFLPSVLAPPSPLLLLLSSSFSSSSSSSSPLLPLVNPVVPCLLLFRYFNRQRGTRQVVPQATLHSSWMARYVQLRLSMSSCEAYYAFLCHFMLFLIMIFYVFLCLSLLCFSMSFHILSMSFYMRFYCSYAIKWIVNDTGEPARDRA